MKTRHWVISDTHLGHNKLTKLGHRPEKFEKMIIDNLSMVGENDVVYHLGDMALYDTKYWNTLFLLTCKARKQILILGNHDNETTKWFYDRGWDAVCSELTLRMFGRKIIMTHIPLSNTELTCRDNDRKYPAVNVHGHVHNTNHRDALLTNRHFAVVMEHEYKPILLQKLIGM